MGCFGVKKDRMEDCCPVLTLLLDEGSDMAGWLFLYDYDSSLGVTYGQNTWL